MLINGRNETIFSLELILIGFRSFEEALILLFDLNIKF